MDAFVDRGRTGQVVVMFAYCLLARAMSSLPFLYVWVFCPGVSIFSLACSFRVFKIVKVISGAEAVPAADSSVVSC